VTLTQRLLVPGLVIGALARIWLLPVPGSPDMGSWKIWTFVGASDPTGLYGVGGSPPERRLLVWGAEKGTTEYPPLALYQMSAVGWIYKHIDPRYADSSALNALVKTPGLLAEIAFVWAMLTWGRRVFGAEPAAWIAIAFWLHPAMIVNGAGLGYLDAQMAVPAALALVAAAADRPALAGALAACAVLTKAQALFAFPALALALAADRRDGRARPILAAAGGFAIAAVATVLPIVIRGAVPNMLQSLGRLAAHDMLSGNAFNFWWIVTWMARAIDTHRDGVDWATALTIRTRILQVSDFARFAGWNAKPIGTALVVLSIATGTWLARTARRPETLALLAAWCVSTYVMFGVQVHENHGLLAVPFLLIGAGLRPAWRPVCLTASILVALNMYLFYGLGDGRSPIVDRMSTGIDLAVLLSAINLGVLAWLTNTVFRHPKPPESHG
jgi:hypothetical protein